MTARVCAPCYEHGDDAFDRAVQAEVRRCKRLGYVFQQPSASDEETHGVGDIVKLRNVNGVIVSYRVTPTGRVRRERQAGKVETN